MRFLLLFALYIGAAVAQTPLEFAADVRIYDDPTINGVLTGTMFYDYTNQKQRIDYTIGPREILDFERKVRYLGCSDACDVETWNSSLPRYFREAKDFVPEDTISVGGRTCQGYFKSGATSDGVNSIWFQLPCRAQFGNGKKIDFTNLRAITSPVFTDYTTWTCPQCYNKMMDVMLVLDESGSLTDADFGTLKNFTEFVANSFQFSPQHVRMGLIFFGDNARLSIGLTADKQSFLNVLRNETAGGGSTCIGCGVSLAHQQFDENGRNNVTKLMIVVTDGSNNVQTNQFIPIVSNAKNAGIIIFAIGAGSVDTSQIQQLASSIPGVQTSYILPVFNHIEQIENVLVNRTCNIAPDTPGNPCEAGCRGFCSCGATCVCPDTCDDNDPCTNDACVAGQVGSGCTYTPMSCPGSVCINGTCYSVTTSGAAESTTGNAGTTVATSSSATTVTQSTSTQSTSTTTTQSTSTTTTQSTSTTTTQSTSTATTQSTSITTTQSTSTATTQSTSTTTTQSTTTATQNTSTATTSAPISETGTGLPSVGGEVQSPASDDDNTLGIAVGGAVGGVCVMLAIIVAVILVRKRQRNGKESKNSRNDKEANNMEMTAADADDSNVLGEIERSLNKVKMNMIDSSAVEIVGQLGEGNFGVVYKGMWNATPVALKKLKDSTQLKEFVAEAKILASINHPNVVRLLGLMKDPDDGCFYIVTEFVSKGSLMSLLKNSTESAKLTQGVLLNMSKQVASAMQYLESEKIVHRDLSVRNLLVTVEDGTYMVKVSDLGLGRSSDYYDDNKKSSAKMPIRWCAPEVLQHREYSHKSDVWAFGITLWEIQSFGVVPYYHHSNSEVVEMVIRGERLDKPKTCPDEVYELMLTCWNAEPAKRPSFAEIFKALKEIANNYEPSKSEQQPYRKKDEKSTVYLQSPTEI